MPPITTLGQLLAHGYELFGSCSDCASRYRMDLPAAQRQPSQFAIDLRALVAERGADHCIIHMPGVRCPYCGGANTASFIVPLGKERRGAADDAAPNLAHSAVAPVRKTGTSDHRSRPARCHRPHSIAGTAKPSIGPPCQPAFGRAG